MHLDLIENTTVFNRLLNSNCCFDGSVLTHLAGASLVQVPRSIVSTMSFKIQNILHREQPPTFQLPWLFIRQQTLPLLW